jgi:hypothetical protein
MYVLAALGLADFAAVYTHFKSTSIELIDIEQAEVCMRNLYVLLLAIQAEPLSEKQPNLEEVLFYAFMARVEIDWVSSLMMFVGHPVEFSLNQDQAKLV